LVELGREDAIAIMDEKTVAMVRRDSFTQLLQCPCCCGVGCHIAMHNASGLVFDDNQNVKQSKRCRYNDTEVTSQNR
jgi:hypothetical protein